MQTNACNLQNRILWNNCLHVWTPTPHEIPNTIPKCKLLKPLLVRIKPIEIRKLFYNTHFYTFTKGFILWNIVCEIVPDFCRSHHNLVKISPIVLEIQGAEIGYFMVLVNNSHVVTHLSWVLIHDHVSWSY